MKIKTLNLYLSSAVILVANAAFASPPCETALRAAHEALIRTPYSHCVVSATNEEGPVTSSWHIPTYHVILSCDQGADYWEIQTGLRGIPEDMRCIVYKAYQGGASISH